MPSPLFTIQRHEFEHQFRSHFTNAFEDWFADLARLLHSNGDIQSPRLTQGDGKIDAYSISEQLVYQCYGPQTWKTGEASSKIERDFRGAHKFLDGKLKKWVFVHNHPTGQLDKDCIKALNNIMQKCKEYGHSIRIEAWGIEEIWDRLEGTVPLTKLQSKFGSADPVTIDFATIEGLLKSLEQARFADNGEPLTQPAEDKLDFNKLGSAYRREIKGGRTAYGQVGKYFASVSARNPEFPELMGEYFRKRYQSLKLRGLEPDEVYDQLRLDAGWTWTPNAKREMATRAILAYFFDSCDIFENPPQEVAS